MGKSPQTEIERKWLVDEIPAGILGHANPYFQAYLAISQTEEVRIRRRVAKGSTKDGKALEYLLTCKNGTGLKRLEVETSITARIFEELLPATNGRIIEKERYVIDDPTLVPELQQADSLKIELDIYNGKLAGLITAEVEFATEQDSQVFIVPKWFGKEVTEDERYKNKNLAVGGV